MNELLISQISAPAVLFLLTCFSGHVLPLVIVGAVSVRILSFLVCLGGGVLFATAFLHIMPEVHEDLEEISVSFPWPEAVVCAGFLLVYILEELLHTCLGHGSDHQGHRHGHSHSPNVIACQSKPNLADGAGEPKVTTPLLQTSPQTSSGETLSKQDDIESGPATTLSQSSLGGSHHAHAVPAPLTLGGLILVIALSFHSVLEGLSLGLQDSVSKTWVLFMAIALHKLVIAFVVGCDLSLSGVSRCALVVYMTLFALMSPIGAFVGLITKQTYSDSIIPALLNGVAAGTLLYVTFFEVLQRQRNSQLSSVCQLIAVLIGFFIIVAMEAMITHDH